MTEVMKKEVNSIEEASAFVDPLIAENKWAITVVRNPDGKFLIQWMEHKMYTARDGLQYRDEVWTTNEGDMVLIQDLDPEHAKNIIRMMLRQEREAEKRLDNIYQQVVEQITEGLAGAENDNSEDVQLPPGGMLH